MQLKALRAYGPIGLRPIGPIGPKGSEAFTIIELIMVVTLIGIMAIFVIPNYTKSIDRAYRKDGTVNLTAIYAAEQIYYNNNNSSYWQADGDVNAINSNLGLGILPNNLTYQCAANNGTTFSCTAIRGLMTLTVNNLSSTPACTGYCP